MLKELLVKYKNITCHYIEPCSPLWAVPGKQKGIKKSVVKPMINKKFNCQVDFLNFQSQTDSKLQMYNDISKSSH